jgi:hypothetical protein
MSQLSVNEPSADGRGADLSKRKVAAHAAGGRQTFVRNSDSVDAA